MDMLTSHTAEAMNLLADVAQHPGFRGEDLDRRRKQRLVRIAQETDNVQNMAMRVGPNAVWRCVWLTEQEQRKSVGAIVPVDMATAFYATGPRDGTLVLAGDLTVRAQAESVARQYFGKWTGKTEAVAAIPPAPAPQAARVVIVDKPGAPQTALIAFGIGVPASSPDTETLAVMNYTLGGSFASRINMNLREAHGYTYGASSIFAQYGDGGMFQAGGLVRSDVTAPAAKEMMGEINKFAAKPSTAEELAAAKIVWSFRPLFETTAAIVRAISSMLFDRPLDYYAKLPMKYEATEADIARVRRSNLHPDRLVICDGGRPRQNRTGPEGCGAGCGGSARHQRQSCG